MVGRGTHKDSLQRASPQTRARWGWLLDTTTTSRICGTIHTLVRSIMGRGGPEEEGWLSWHTRTLRDARHLVVGRLGCTIAESLLRKGATKWEEWLQGHEATFIRRLIGWRSTACDAWEGALRQHIARREGTWRRERVGRPQRRWEAPLVAAWGPHWMCSTQRPAAHL